VEPTEGEFVWHDEQITLAGQYGLKIIGNLSGLKHVPRWVTKQGALPDLEAYKKFVRTVVARYKPHIKHWTICDEADRSTWSASDYARYHQAAAQIIKELDPQAKVIINSTGRFQDQVMEQIGPEYVDIVSGNHLHRPGYFAHNVAAAAKYRKPVWATGVGMFDRTFRKVTPLDFHPKSYRDPRVAAKDVMNNVIQELSMGCERFVYYDGRYMGRVVYDLHQRSFFEYDGALTAAGAAYAGVIYMLDGAKYVGESFVSGDEMFRGYLFETLSGAPVLAVTNREAPCRMTARIALQARDLKYADGFGNVVMPRATKDGIVLTLHEQPIYVMGERAELIAFGRALANVAVRYLEVPRGEENLQAGELSLVLNPKGGFRVFAAGAAILGGDGVSLGAVRGYSPAGPAETHETPEGHRVVVTFDKGHSRARRVTTLTEDRCVIEWSLAAETDEGGKGGATSLKLAKSLVENRQIHVREVVDPTRAEEYSLFFTPGHKKGVKTKPAKKTAKRSISLKEDFPKGTRVYRFPFDSFDVTMVIYPVQVVNGSGHIGWRWDWRYYPAVSLSDGWFTLAKSGTMKRKIEIRYRARRK